MNRKQISRKSKEESTKNTTAYRWSRDFWKSSQPRKQIIDKSEVLYEEQHNKRNSLQMDRRIQKRSLAN
jgi:hypothetical protein